MLISAWFFKQQEGNDVAENCVRFLYIRENNLHAALHIMSDGEKNSTVPVRNHDGWCFFPAGADQSQPSKHVAFLFRVIGEHGICAHPSVFHLLSPPSSLASRGCRGPQGRALLTCFNRPCSVATPATQLISTFQFLASMKPRGQIVWGHGRWGGWVLPGLRESRI